MTGREKGRTSDGVHRPEVDRHVVGSRAEETWNANDGADRVQRGESRSCQC
jgi:hypothetical protein